MKTYNSKNIRNIVIAGHGSRGKTTLCEAMLYLAGATGRLGRVAEGNTVMDFDEDEKKRGVSVGVGVAPLEWKDVKINLIDTPGLFDFAGGLSEGMRAAGCAIIVTDAEKAKYDVGAEKAFKAAEKRGISKFFVVTKTDAENANFGNIFEEIKAIHGPKLCPVVVPYIEDNRIKYFVNFAQNKAYEYKDGKSSEVEMPQSEKLDAMREMFNESVAESSEELMEKFFAGEKFTEVEAISGLLQGVVDGAIYPVYACSGYNLDAVDLLLDGIVNLGPSACEKSGEIATDLDGNEMSLPCDENGDLAAICFKTIVDPFIGKMSYVKVVSGKITADTSLYNSRTGEVEKVGKLIMPRGGKQEDTSCITAGDIGAITKMSALKTGDTLSSPKKPLSLKGIKLPTPCLSMAVKARKKGEEDKVVAGLLKLMEEDPSIDFYTNQETREQIVSGLGEQHIDIIVSKLKNKFGVEVDLLTPKVAYRETIKKKVEAQGRHKKQSGGHGQFGDVFIRFEPCDCDDLIFEEEVFGGSVPKNYFPAVEKGLRESIEKGVLAGYPMVGVKATLYDGSYHSVDSSEMAFKMAASLAFKNGISQANPVILEPIGTLRANLPDENMGDIMGDITKRRGRVLGMGPSEEEAGMQEIVAEVPMAEMGDFSIVLRSVTRGKGFFSTEFARYEEAPANIAQKVIEESQKNF